MRWPSCPVSSATVPRLPAVDAGILGYNMYLNGQEFYAGDGIVTRGIEAPIHNVGRLGRDGMRETNEEIIKMMIDE